MIYITKDNFVWLDITESKNIEDIFASHENLYAVYDDDSESLIESIDELMEAISIGVKICIEVGHLPKPKTKWFLSADKILKNGYWYAKINDIKLG